MPAAASNPNPNPSPNPNPNPSPNPDSNPLHPNPHQVPPPAHVPGEQRTYYQSPATYGVPGASPVSGGMALAAALAHGGSDGWVGSSPQRSGAGAAPPPPLGLQGVQGRGAQSSAAVQSVQSLAVPMAASSMGTVR